MTCFPLFFGEGSGSEQVRYPLSDEKEPPTDNVERFLFMLRFDSREKLKDFQMDLGEWALFFG